MKVESKKVLTIQGLKTEEEFTNYIETTPVIALWNDKLICWYEKRNGNKLNEIHGKVLSCKRTFIIERDNNKAVYSLDGEVIIPFYDYDSIVEHPYAIEVEKAGMKAAYSYEGKRLVPFIYPRLDFNRYGISSVYGGFIQGALYSYKGEVIVPNEYKIHYIDDDSIICSIEDEKGNEAYGMYSHDGDIIVPFEYDSLAQYNKCILAEKDGKCGMLSNTGKVIVPFEYKEIKEVSKDNEDYFIAKKKDIYGHALYKYTGKEILPPVYNDIEYAAGCVITLKNGYYGLYTLEGLELLKPIYESIYCDKKDIFIARTAGGSFYYIASLNRRIYAHDVSYIGNEYVEQNNGAWTLIEKC